MLTRIGVTSCFTNSLTLTVDRTSPFPNCSAPQRSQTDNVSAGSPNLCQRPSQRQVPTLRVRLGPCSIPVLLEACLRVVLWRQPGVLNREDQDSLTAQHVQQHGLLQAGAARR